MKKVVFSIQYAGLTLPVMKNEQGQDVTPLKPISDLFGLSWRDQRKKISGSPFLMSHLGIAEAGSIPKTAIAGEDNLTSNTKKRGQRQQSGTDISTSNATYLPELLIRVDRVAAYLLSINPDRVRGAGNSNGAEFLEAKNTEWADAIHDWEEIGVAVNVNHAKSLEQTRKQRQAFFQAIGVQNRTEDAAARKAIGQVAAQMAAELGIQYQPDLTA